MQNSILSLIKEIDKCILELHLTIRKKRITATRKAYVNLEGLINSLKLQLSTEFIEDNFTDLDRHMHFVGYYIKDRNFDWIKKNFYDIQDVDFPKIKEEIIDHLVETQVNEQLKSGKKGNSSLSKNIFIVHGSDHKPMKELKTILIEYGLNPIILHEQPSGSRTIVEKLEKYSDVGYAFVILTPDDIGGIKHNFDKFLKNWDLRLIDKVEQRARQNVILEFGYFIGKLRRDRVCCLHQGKVGLPSDMHGIVYIPFENSVNEIREKIIKELQEAGYEV
jgi:predicted nucleotide-binding protein